MWLGVDEHLICDVVVGLTGGPGKDQQLAITGVLFAWVPPEGHDLGVDSFVLEEESMLVYPDHNGT